VEKGKKCRIYNEENVRGNSEGGVMGHGFRFSVAKKGSLLFTKENISRTDST